MNERIKELIEQATSTVTVNHEGYMGRAYTSQEEVFDKEKFAELIVRECVQVAVNKDSGCVHSADVAGYMAAGRSTAAQMIREHFGVEE